jgi:hypothetical protein
MHWQLVYGSSLFSAAGHRPTLKSAWTAVENILYFRASKSRCERHIERKVCGRIGGCCGRTCGTPLRLGILMRPRHAEGSRHSLTKPMASLASEAGDFVHLANALPRLRRHEKNRGLRIESGAACSVCGHPNVAEEARGDAGQRDRRRRRLNPKCDSSLDKAKDTGFEGTRHALGLLSQPPACEQAVKPSTCHLLPASDESSARRDSQSVISLVWHKG